MTATTAVEGLELIRRELPDMVLLYPDFGDLTLVQAIHEIRALSHVPILVLAKEEDNFAEVTSLLEGADGYLRLPRSPREISARIWALVRRARVWPATESGGLGSKDEIFHNLASGEAFIGGAQLRTTPAEYRVLLVLLANRGMVVPYERLVREVWGEHAGSLQLLRKYVQRLRNKLGDDPRKPGWIFTINRVGYSFRTSAWSPPVEGQLDPK
jgi:two-component system KDP operon response regulator KdpE